MPIEGRRSMRLPRLIPWVVAAVLAVACQSGDSDDGESIPPVTAIPAVVDTAQSGCDTNVDGACWLPLYPNPEHKGTPLNQREAPDSPCKRAKEVGCWPQPGTTVTLTCLKTVEGRLWFGVSVPPERVLSPVHTAVPPRLPVAGYNLAQWFRPTTEVNELRTC